MPRTNYLKIYFDYRTKHPCLTASELREIRDPKSFFSQNFGRSFATYFSDVDKVFFKKLQVITRSPSLGPEEINALLKNIEQLLPWYLNLASPFVRNLFLHPNCQVDAEYYVLHPSLIFRRAVVNYRHISKSQLNRLANDEDTEVVFGALTHPKIGRGVLWEHFDKATNRYYVLKNSRCPDQLINRALSEQKAEHLLALAQNSGIDKAVFDKVLPSLENLKEELLQKLISSPNNSRERMEELYTSFGKRYMISFLKNPNCPPNILERIIDQIFADIEKNMWLLDGVIFHPNCTKEIVYRLYHWINEEEQHIRKVLMWAKSNGVEQDINIDPKTKLLIVTLLASIAFSHHVTPEIIEELSYHRSSAVRTGVAMNVHCPPHLLEVLSKDSSNYVRSMVALNPSTPEDIIIKMLDKENKLLRKLVLGNANVSDRTLKLLAFDPIVGEDAIERLSDINLLLTLRLMGAPTRNLSQKIQKRIRELRGDSS